MRALRGPARFLLSAGVLAAALLFAIPSGACSINFRSLDWIVGHSPLILVGTVESIEKLEPGDQDRALFGGPEAGTGPVLAKVRVHRVLHGTWTSETVQIRSGPVAS
ncbi:MAG: hypothetical protein K8T20_10685 [Planctomycetes bacterium]|nr:hypothetical protein [Planctomycetota bacterium]